MIAPLLQVHLSAYLGAAAVIENASFDLSAGEALGVIGSSGAGKSTLVMALLGLLPWRGGHTTGKVLFEGTDLLAIPEREARQLRGRRFALVPQSPMTALNGALSLQAHFAEAWRAHRSGAPGELGPRLAELLGQVQLPGGPEFLRRKPGQISVGQAQRVLIALALLHKPALLIADEPTSALDPATQTEIVRLLSRLNRESGTALLYVSHDLVSVLQLCDRVAVLDHGRIVESLQAREIGARRHHPATAALLAALPAPPDVLRSHHAQALGPAGTGS